MSTALVDRRLVLEHARAAILQHPARRGRARQDLEHDAAIDAGLAGERERLGGSGDVDAAEELVDGLDHGALARALADVEELVAERRRARGRAAANTSLRAPPP